MQLKIPAAILIRLAAILQIREWQTIDAFSDIGAQFPDHRSLANNLIKRCCSNRESLLVVGITHDELSAQIFRCWIKNFCWAGPSLSESSVLMTKDLDDERLIDALTDFLLAILD